jgi:uncharacterized protein with NRDE domain
MCVILLAYQQHPDYPLVLAANRDEFYERPTAPADFWKDAPHLLAGRDLKAGGTWLGMDRYGRFAAISNYRDPASHKEHALSRGLIVSDFLRGQQTPREYIHALSPSRNQYNGFNLLAGNRLELWYYSNRTGEARLLDSGLYGLSNHLLDIPWPKVKQGKERLRDLLSQDRTLEVEAIFEILSDRSMANDDCLPDTGIGLEIERVLSPLFIKSLCYGTRSSTVLLIDRHETVTFIERSFEPGSDQSRTVRHGFKIREES